MKYIFALAALTAAVTAQNPPGCQSDFDGTFVIRPTLVNAAEASPGAKMVKRQQNVRTICGSTPIVTLQGGILKDQQGRTGNVVANSQFQFDEPLQENALFTSGFSVCQNNTLAYPGSAIFYQCLSGDPQNPEDRSRLFNNLYTQPQGPTSGEADQCDQIYIEVIGCEPSPEQSSSFGISATGGSPATSASTPASTSAASSPASSPASQAPAMTQAPAVPYPVGNNGTSPSPTATGSASPPGGSGSPAPSPFVPGSGAASLIIGGKLVALAAGIVGSSRVSHFVIPKHPASTATSPSTASEPSGDISSVFPSLSGNPSEPLPSRFADIKKLLIHGHEAQVQDSWDHLLSVLQEKREEIRTKGSAIVPEINYCDLDDVEQRTRFRDALHKTGVAVIRGVVQGEEALGWKELVKRYIASNPGTRGVILSLISTSHPVSYADRLRIRQPGDSAFALGPHVDGGSCERWEPSGYGLGGVYNQIFHGNWEEYSPWEMTSRALVKSDLYNGPGSCSMYRMFQAWVAISNIQRGQGHLKVCPMVKEAMAYMLLRPFFTPRKGIEDPGYLDIVNWTLEDPMTSTLQGAVPASGQELNRELHPHLALEDTMVHVPKVKPGDYVAWHCDTIHAVDSTHTGTSDSSVLYIPACPLTEANAEYLSRQRETFAEGTPAPDFPSGEGESEHRGRLTPEYVMKNISLKAQRAMGLAAFNTKQRDMFNRERATLRQANRILGFAET
ncbi:MAG: hypothetical protein Q9209_001199 [Squamulea sp. 1 TL-2023]